MSFRHAYIRATALAPLLALAVYGALGVFGHALHGVLPCSDGACGANVVAAKDHHGCCCHSTAPRGSAADGPEVGADGHDAASCSLCTVLAQIKTGRVAIFTAELTVARSFDAPAAREALQPVDLVLLYAARGPPIG